MMRTRTYRVLVRTGQIHSIDIPAPDEEHAVARAERLWYGGDSARFDCVHHRVAEVFEIDADASMHLEDVCNEHRSIWAANALRAFARETLCDMGREALHDLLCNLGHYADRHGLDFETELRRAAETWAEEKSEEGQL